MDGIERYPSFFSESSPCFSLASRFETVKSPNSYVYEERSMSSGQLRQPDEYSRTMPSSLRMAMGNVNHGKVRVSRSTELSFGDVGDSLAQTATQSCL